MTIGTLASKRVVDLLRYKREKQQQQLDFGPGPEPTPSLAPVTASRPLTPNEVTHRERMVRHLGRKTQ